MQFTIKVYSTHKGVTCEILKCRPGDELILHDAWGTIAYKGEGVFIAGGAGVTPFISILRQLEKFNKIGDNKLIFANKTKSDIILEDYFTGILKGNFINILSDEITEEYPVGHITEEFLSKHIKTINQKFYICGPEAMMDAVEQQLISLQVSLTSIIKERF